LKRDSVEAALLSLTSTVFAPTTGVPEHGKNGRKDKPHDDATVAPCQNQG
jgi:hypothetical protein